MKYAYSGGEKPLEGYTIKCGIGRGGFGEVYFATSDAGKEVALKHIQRNLDIELRGVKQCLNLKHPNLVDLYDIKYDDHGEAWVVMEYVAGDSLKDLIENHPNGLSKEEALKWFSGVISGTAYLHSQGLVHRDIKPGNLFIDDGIVKIGDYGLSKFISCSRRSGQTESVGTFHYMAPEIGQGRYGREIDIYALGIILHEMLSGHVPFDGETSQEIIMKHLTASPDLSKVPAEFRPIIQKALEKDPAKRYNTVEELAADLPIVVDLPTPQASPLFPSEAALPVAASVATEEISFIEENDDQIRFLGEVQNSQKNHQATLAPPVINPPRGGEGQVSAQQPGRMYQPPGGQGSPNTSPALTVAPPIGNRLNDPISNSIHRYCHWWSDPTVSTALKIATIPAIGVPLFLLLVFATPLCILAGLGYGVCVLVQLLRSPPPRTEPTEQQSTSRPSQQPLLATASPQSASAPISDSPENRWQRRQPWDEIARKNLRTKASSVWFAELLISYLWVLVLVALHSAIWTTVVDPGAGTDLAWWSHFAWFTVVCTFASWILVFIGKLWESQNDYSSMHRRIVCALVGVSVGALSFGLAEILFLNLSVFEPTRFAGELDYPAWDSLPSNLYEPQSGAPKMLASVLFFMTFFFLRRWWFLTDSLRRSKVSITSIFVSLLSAFVAAVIIPTPLAWALCMAIAISASIQFSSSWIPKKERRSYGQ